MAGHQTTGIIELEQTPEDVVERWVEGEEGLIWPGNIHLTQVLWRPTTHVGCAMASRSKSGGEGGTCATQVCRYARPANCNMDDYKTQFALPYVLQMAADMRREAELYDEVLFKDHTPREDCPICFFLRHWIKVKQLSKHAVLNLSAMVVFMR